MRRRQALARFEDRTSLLTSPGDLARPGGSQAPNRRGRMKLARTAGCEDGGEALKESLLFWLVLAAAAAFLGYLVFDGLLQWTRHRRHHRRRE